MKKFIYLMLAACVCACILPFAACSGGGKTTLSEYELYVSYNPDERTLTGTVDFTFINDTDNELSDLKFNLYGNAFRENAKYMPISDAYKSKAYYSGVDYGRMTVQGVENCAGWNVAGEDENLLVVNLIQPIYPAESIRLQITYVLKLAKVNHRTGVTANTVNLGNFYPILCAYSNEGFIECPYSRCGDPFVSDCANYSVTIDMPENYVAAGSGVLQKESVAGGRKKCSYTLSAARDFALVLSDKFQKVSQEVAGVTVNYYHYSDENPQVSLSAAADSLGYFISTFGGYAYPQLSVVQTGFCYGGMEYPALTMISDSLDSDSEVYTIVHETAHQWWYAMVGSDQLNNAWQDEGLAEYSTLMFFEKNPTYGFTRTGIVGEATKSYRAFFSVYNQLNGTVDTSMNRNLKDYSGEYEYNNVTYNKGVIMFDTLRNSVGDEKFCECLKKYFSQNIYRIASPEDLFGCFIKSGTDTEGFFDAFINGKIII